MVVTFFGKILWSDGGKIANAQVILKDGNSANPGVTDFTAADGDYSVTLDVVLDRTGRYAVTIQVVAGGVILLSLPKGGSRASRPLDISVPR